MIIRNTSKKIIGIEKTILLPDDELSVSNDIAELPAIKAMVRLGQLVLVEERIPQRVEATKAVEEAKGENEQEAEKQTKKNGRKTKKDVESEPEKDNVEKAFEEELAQKIFG